MATINKLTRRRQRNYEKSKKSKKTFKRTTRSKSASTVFRKMTAGGIYASRSDISRSDDVRMDPSTETRENSSTQVFRDPNLLAEITKTLDLSSFAALSGTQKVFTAPPPQGSDSVFHIEKLRKIRKFISELKSTFYKRKFRERLNMYDLIYNFTGLGPEGSLFSDKYAMMELFNTPAPINTYIPNFYAENAKLLKYAALKLRNDPDVVMSAVKVDGMALYYASERLRSDKEIVMTAVKQCGIPLIFASNLLRKDIQFITAARDNIGIEDFDYDIPASESLIYEKRNGIWIPIPFYFNTRTVTDSTPFNKNIITHPGMKIQNQGKEVNHGQDPDYDDFLKL